MVSTATKQLINEDDHWKEEAKNEQLRYTEYLEAIDVCPLDTVKDRLAAALFGLPETLENNYEKLSYEYYNKNQKKMVDDIGDCIFKNQKCPNKMKIYFSLVLIIGRTDGTMKKNFQDWVFRVPAKDKFLTTEYNFIDRNCRVYKNWEDYLNNNTLCEAIICYPFNGQYTSNKKEPKVDFCRTPACKVTKKVLFGFDVASSVTGLVAAGVTTACVFVPLAAPLVWGAVATGVLAGSYGAGRSIECLIDRDNHGQTLSFRDSQARSAWLGATTPFFGMAAGGATTFATTASRIGLSVSDAAKLAANVTNGINCVASGVCFIHDIHNVIECKLNSKDVSLLQIFNCIASALLFANAVISAHQARMLLQTIPEGNRNGWFEMLHSKLSQTTVNENGMKIRPTNLALNTNIAQFINIGVRWGSLILNIPPPVCKCIEDIVKFIKLNIKEYESFPVFLTGLIPLLKVLWEKLSEYIQNQQTYNKCKELYCVPMKEKDDSKKQMFKNAVMKNNTNSHRKEFQIAQEPENETIPFGNKINSKDTYVNGEDFDSSKITIIDPERKGENETIQNIVAEIFKTENMSASEFLQITYFFLERLKKDVAHKEQEFQNALHRAPHLTEKDLEFMYQIEGNRIQSFANNIMKSYKDFKLISAKQDYKMMIENEGMQMPLYNAPDNITKILHYSSIQKEGTNEEKYLNILQQAGVALDLTDCILYGSENSCFVEINNSTSKYIMVGVVNFVEGNHMLGIIVLQERTC